MNGKLVGFLIAVVLAVVIYANIAGRHAQRDQDAQQTAKALSDSATAFAKRLEAAQRHAFDSAQRVTDSVQRAAQAKINQATRATNAAISQSAEIGKQARQLLADSLASVDTLRTALRGAVGAMDSLVATYTAERAANVSARQADSTAHAQQVAKLRAGFDTTINAKDSAARAVGKAMAAEIAQAEGHGLRVGRLQGLTAGALLLGGLVYLVK